MTAQHPAPGPAGWIHRLAPAPEDAGRTPVSSPRGLTEAAERLGPEPVAWAVAVGERLARAVVREVPELGGGPAPFETLRMGTEAVTLRTLLLLSAPGAPDAGRPVPEESLFGDREFARRRLGLDKVLRGIRVAHAALAHDLMTACQDLAEPADRADQFRRISELLLLFTDEFASRMTAEYQAEHDRWLTSGAAAREETVRALLAGRAVAPGAARDVLGYRLEGRHLAVVAWCDRPGADTAGHLQRAAAGLLHRRGCTATLLVPTGATTVWAWGEPRADDPVPDAGACPDGVRLAVGSVRHGPDGFRRSHEDARHAQRVAHLNPDGTGPVVDHTDVELAALLSADLPALRRFVADELGDLAADDRHTRHLRETLRLYLCNERGLTACAAELHVARNTVTYRVKRAQSLLGHDLTSRLTPLMTALEAARILGPAVLRTDGENAHDTPSATG